MLRLVPQELYVEVGHGEPVLNTTIRYVLKQWEGSSHITIAASPFRVRIENLPSYLYPRRSLWRCVHTCVGWYGPRDSQWLIFSNVFILCIWWICCYYRLFASRLWERWVFLLQINLICTKLELMWELTFRFFAAFLSALSACSFPYMPTWLGIQAAADVLLAESTEPSL